MANASDRREAREDILLGHVLLKQRFITPEQLKQAVAEQAAGLARGRKRPRRLGVILASQKRISDQQFISFQREIEERVLEEEAALAADLRLGEKLASRHVISREQLEECLRLQQEAHDRGDEEIRRLGEILIEEGYTKPEAVAQAMVPDGAKPYPPVLPAHAPLRPAAKSGTPAAPAPAPVKPSPAAPARPPLRPVAKPAPAAPARPPPPPAVRAAPPKPAPVPPPPPPAAPRIRDSSKPDIPLIAPPPEETPDDEDAISAT